MEANHTVKVFSALDKQLGISVPAISGTAEGHRLARKTIELLDTCSKIVLDFSEIETMSSSAACAFWNKLFCAVELTGLKKVSFINICPSVHESLEYGYNFIVSGDSGLGPRGKAQSA